METRVGLSTTPVSSDLAWAWKFVSRAAPLHGVPSWKTTLGRSVTVHDGVRGVGHDGLGQVGRPVPVGQNDGQRVEDGAGVHDSDLVEAGLGRVEARLLGVYAEDQRASLLGSLRAHPVAARAVGRGTGDAVEPQRRARPPPPRRRRPPLRPAAPSDDQISRPSVLHFSEPTGPPEGSRATLVPRIPCVGAVRWPSCRPTGICRGFPPGWAAVRRRPARRTSAT